MRRRADRIAPYPGADDPFGVPALTTHPVPLDEAPDAHRKLPQKPDGYLKVVLRP